MLDTNSLIEDSTNSKIILPKSYSFIIYLYLALN